MRYSGVIILCIFFVLLSSVSGARILGAIYDQNLETIPKSVVVINTTPEQTYVSRFGGYNFDVRDGVYALTVTLTRNGISKEIASGVIEIDDSRDEFRKDLFMYADFDEAKEFDESQKFSQFLNNYWGVIIVIIALIIGLIVLSRFKRPIIQTVSKEEVQNDPMRQRILDLLKRNNNEVTQKEIRREFPVSEAKISLVVSQMEQDGLIEKTKQGRKNIIRSKTHAHQ